VDLGPKPLARGIERLRVAQQALIEAGRLTPQQAETAVDRIAPLTSLERACEGTQLVVEAIPEELSLKQEMFRQLDLLCPPAAILASNTSGLSIRALAGVTRRAAQVAGMHFWNPPHIIPLVEVTQGEHTSEGTVQLLADLCHRIGKHPIRVRHEVPGFIGNRLQYAVLREALHLLAEGVASIEDIDAAMTYGPGLRYALIGPLRTADLGGLDVFYTISEYLFAELSAAQRPPALLAEMVDAGELGVKTGQGFYGYADGASNTIIAHRDRVLLDFLSVLESRKEGSDEG
jgi:3-hydroxybutyryl-CoA dehydrogenase